MQLFYTPELTPDTKVFEFNKDEGRHIVKVLRAKTGDIVETTNGRGYFFTARIIEANPKHCTAKVEAFRKQPVKPYHLHLAVAPTKNSGRYEWFLEKATEIGIDEITPVICSRSERREIKPVRMEKVLEAAMKQSLRPFLPKLNKAVSFGEFIRQPLTGNKYIAHCGESEKTDLRALIEKDQNITILIGPEGDFTSDEIVKATEHTYRPVTLGASRMRTETAAIMAAAIVAIMKGS